MKDSSEPRASALAVGRSSSHPLSSVEEPGSGPVTVALDEARGAEAVKRKRIAIFIVAYNAAGTLSRVLERIPEQTWDKVEEVFVFDDSSQDSTYLVGLGFKALHDKTKLTVFANEKNLGYGGNQKRGFRYAIDRGYDIVALLHGDGQYAPEELPKLLEPLERGDTDAVFGSRMMVRGGARRGRMPLYKYLGNRILTAFENFVLGTSLSEFHSGYRLYSCRALERLPFEKNTDDFHFDTEIIIQMHAAGMRIQEMPIPTYYGDEICYVNGTKYAYNVVRSVIGFKLHELGIRTWARYVVPPAYTLKKSKLSSHSQILRLIGQEPRQILDVGCGTGELGHVLRQRGHHVVGIDIEPPRHELSEFIQADLTAGLPLAADRKFDIVVLADILESLPEPSRLLQQLQPHLRPESRILVSSPNIVHWSVRMQMALGRFEYTNKGILERGHLRFFTRRSARRMFEESGYDVDGVRTVPIPWENIIPPSGVLRFLPRLLERTDRLLGQVFPNFFAYQSVFELRRRSEDKGG